MKQTSPFLSSNCCKFANMDNYAKKVVPWTGILIIMLITYISWNKLTSLNHIYYNLVSQTITKIASSFSYKSSKNWILCIYSPFTNRIVTNIPNHEVLPDITSPSRSWSWRRKIRNFQKESNPWLPSTRNEGITGWSCGWKMENLRLLHLQFCLPSTQFGWWGPSQPNFGQNQFIRVMGQISKWHGRSPDSKP